MLAGSRPRQLVLLGIGAAIVIGAVLHSGLLGSTQQDRLTSFVNQDQAPKVDLSDASSAEYNLRQSKIAIGSGGWTGKGVFNGTQTRLNNVPFQHTDFIFTAVGEQLGLLGAASLLAAVLDHGLADPADRPARPRRLRDARVRRHPGDVRLPDLRERRDDDGHHADHRHPAAVHVLRRLSSTITYLVAIGLVLNVHMRRFA